MSLKAAFLAVPNIWRVALKPSLISLCPSSSTKHLLFILLFLILHDIEEPKLIHALTGGHYTQPVTKLLLLQELLGQVLEVAAGELDVRDDFDLIAADLGDGHIVPEIAGAAFDLDAVMQELLEGADIEDLVGDGLRAVDGKLVAPVSVRQRKAKLLGKFTFLVTF
jgi:hypothetical protein